MVKWNIGDTGKMVVVMYDKPWSTLFHTNILAIGIFPKIDVVTEEDLNSFYNKIYSEDEDGFQRKYFPGLDGWSSPVRYRDDLDFMVDGAMGDAPKSSINER